jgi:hypothetical protein
MKQQQKISTVRVSLLIISSSSSVYRSGSDENIISIIYIKTGKSGKYNGGNNDTSFCRDTDGNDSGVVMMIILETMFLRSCHHNNSCDSKDNGDDGTSTVGRDTSGNDSIGNGNGGNDDSCNFIKSS